MRNHDKTRFICVLICARVQVLSMKNARLQERERKKGEGSMSGSGSNREWGSERKNGGWKEDSRTREVFQSVVDRVRLDQYRLFCSAL